VEALFELRLRLKPQVIRELVDAYEQQRKEQTEKGETENEGSLDLSPSSVFLVEDPIIYFDEFCIAALPGMWVMSIRWPHSRQRQGYCVIADRLLGMVVLQAW